MPGDDIKFWEKKLQGLGLGADLPTEAEKAGEHGVEIVSADSVNHEFQALTKRLQEEDPRNIFGGFPTSMDTLISLVDTLKAEWLEQGIPESEIHLALHASCINGHDCLNVIRNGGQRYHYNTKRIHHYSREHLLARLKARKIPFREM